MSQKTCLRRTAPAPRTLEPGTWIRGCRKRTAAVYLRERSFLRSALPGSETLRETFGGTPCFDETPDGVHGCIKP